MLIIPKYGSMAGASEAYHPTFLSFPNREIRYIEIPDSYNAATHEIIMKTVPAIVFYCATGSGLAYNTDGDGSQSNPWKSLNYALEQLYNVSACISEHTCNLYVLLLCSGDIDYAFMQPSHVSTMIILSGLNVAGSSFFAISDFGYIMDSSFSSDYIIQIERTSVYNCAFERVITGGSISFLSLDSSDVYDCLFSCECSSYDGILENVHRVINCNLYNCSFSSSVSNSGYFWNNYINSYCLRGEGASIFNCTATASASYNYVPDEAGDYSCVCYGFNVVDCNLTDCSGSGTATLSSYASTEYCQYSLGCGVSATGSSVLTSCSSSGNGLVHNSVCSAEIQSLECQVV